MRTVFALHQNLQANSFRLNNLLIEDVVIYDVFTC